MRKSVILFLSLIIVLVVCLIISTLINRADIVNRNAISDNSCIVIDAGHGGKDSGTVGIDGALEKTINLDIALDLYDFLRITGYNCHLVRDGDYELYYEEEEKSRSDLYNRLDFVNSFVENNEFLCKIMNFCNLTAFLKAFFFTFFDAVYCYKFFDRGILV